MHDQRPVTPAEQVSALPVSSVAARGPAYVPGTISSPSPGFPAASRPPDESDWTSAQSQHLPSGLPTTFGQGYEKQLPILAIQKNRLFPVAPIYHVINGARIFDSKLTCHASQIERVTIIYKYQELTPVRPAAYQNLRRQLAQTAWICQGTVVCRSLAPRWNRHRRISTKLEKRTA